MGNSSTEEFPLLSALGLYASDIRGDGNCLFNALSDQLYGHQDEHAAIRARVIEYMREHAAYYKQFIDVHPGGGIRRNPKRKNAGAYSAPAVYAPPSQADIDRVFDSHLQSMAKGGTYGDNMEITAFSSAFNVDVKIYQRDFAYVVPGGPPDIDRPVAHIAYHIWEHYSSIRNIAGPHTGLPSVTPKVLSPEEEQSQKEKLASAPHVLPWQIDALSHSLPFLLDKPSIRRALQATKGNMDAAWERLVAADRDESTSSQPESSSVERDADSDDEASSGPSKKQDRRLSRGSRVRQQGLTKPRHALAILTTLNDSQESLQSHASETWSAPESSQQSTLSHLIDTDDELAVGSAQESPSSPLISPVRPPIRLKLHPPRPPDPSLGPGKTQLRQIGPRPSARDRKDIKKQAQKAARRARQQAEARDKRTDSPSRLGVAMRQKGMTDTPPIETLRTLFI